MRFPRLALPLLASAALHVAWLSTLLPDRPEITWEEEDDDDDDGDPVAVTAIDEDLGDLPQAPLALTILDPREEPPPEPPAPPEPPEEPEPVAMAPPPPPEPVPLPTPPEPEPEEPLEPLAPPPELDAPPEIVADAETAAPEDDDDGEAHEQHRIRVERKKRGPRAARTQRAERRAPCGPPSPSIARVSEDTWGVERSIIDYYATHLRALDELGTVWTHKGADGKLDGFRVGLARCSLLRQAGLRSGDVVHDVNGIEIHSVIEAVRAYFVLRSQREVSVRITRKGKALVLNYQIERSAKGARKR